MADAPAPKCERCGGTGVHVLADVPGEGRICGGRCPNGCALQLEPLPLEQRRELWRALPPEVQATVRRHHAGVAAELDGGQPSTVPVADRSCGNCRWWVNCGNWGECHANAPVVVSAEVGPTNARWPHTRMYDVCGFHRPDSAKEAARG